MESRFIRFGKKVFVYIPMDSDVKHWYVMEDGD